TSNEIEEILLRQSRLPNTETLIIYFAGHGHRTDVKKLYLVAKNTKKIDDYLLGGIDFDFISNVVLRNATAKQKILILDACHSGIATQGTDDMMQKMDIKGSYVLASSPGDEVSYFEKNSRNTYFTGVLLNVLKDGIENSNEMIALDDLYEYSKDHLTEKNFPHPIYKNELNISPSNFFIARNPLFSFEKLRRRPELLMREGRFEDALYEYRMLLQKFPDDITIRQKVSECEVETLFSHLSQDGDEFFFAKNYKAATEKYKKALQVKDDLSVRGKLNKCNDFLRQNPIVEKNTIKKEDENVVRKIQSESIEADKEKNIKKHVHKDDTINITTPVSNDKISGILLASVWAVASFIFVASYLGDLESSKIFSRISVPAAIIGSILFGIRRSRVTITEILIYAHGLFFCVFPLIVELQDARGTSHTSATLVFLAYIVAYAILITRTLKGFKLVDMIIASVGILYLGSVFMSIFAYNIQSDEDGTRASSTGFIAGLILAIVAIILMRKKWLQLKKK
ncbi:MAG TPA: caspase family protein, partial [Chitinophagaceae bacterium]